MITILKLIGLTILGGILGFFLFLSYQAYMGVNLFQ